MYVKKTKNNVSGLQISGFIFVAWVEGYLILVKKIKRMDTEQIYIIQDIV